MRVGPGASEGILTPADVNIDAGGTILEGEKKKRKRNTTEIVPVSLALVANIGELILELSDDLRDSTSRERGVRERSHDCAYVQGEERFAGRAEFGRRERARVRRSFVRVGGSRTRVCSRKD